MRLSPRRIKSTPTMILYELRMIGLKTRPSSLLRKLEAIIKKWRGLVRWYMQGHTSMRGEVVVHIVGERFGRVNRVDNLVASWRRAIARILLNKKDHQQGGHKGVQQGGVQYGGMHHKVTQHEGVQQEVAQRGGVQQEVAQQEAQHPGNLQGGQVGASTNSKRHDLSKLKKATWIAVGSTNIYMDVQVMHENFDVAKAKMWAEVASSVDATMCSHTEPALPVDIGHLSQHPRYHRVANMSRANRLHGHVQSYTQGSSTRSTRSTRNTIQSLCFPSKSEARNTTPYQYRHRPPK